VEEFDPVILRAIILCNLALLVITVGAFTDHMRRLKKSHKVMVP
jgi:hypothetical protein